MNRRRIRSSWRAFTGVEWASTPIPRLCDARVMPPKWTLLRRFIDVTMESSKVAYYKPMPRLWFLTGWEPSWYSDSYRYMLLRTRLGILTVIVICYWEPVLVFWQLSLYVTENPSWYSDSYRYMLLGTVLVFWQLSIYVTGNGLGILTVTVIVQHKVESHWI